MNIQQFQKDLINWYLANKRDLPWRKNSDAYRVWVSEIMLQQTRVDTVIPYFNRFMEWFPSIEVFANADEEQILKAWEGLGYYSRVRNLQTAARDVVENHMSIVPPSVDDLLKLKGVGTYTAGAVASIAYQIPVPAVDGNVMRVYSRLFTIYDDIALPATKRIFERKVGETIAEDDPSSFNQGLMELGALICTPKNPKCSTCPVQTHCTAFEQDVVEELPVKTRKVKVKNVYLVSAIIQNESGEILIQKRPAKGLLASLWEMPTIEVQNDIFQSETVVEEQLADTIGLSLYNVEKLTDIKHEFTHLTWKIAGYKASCSKSTTSSERLRWIKVDEVKEYAFPTSFQKLFKSFYESDCTTPKQ